MTKCEFSLVLLSRETGGRFWRRRLTLPEAPLVGDNVALLLSPGGIHHFAVIRRVWLPTEQRCVLHCREWQLAHALEVIEFEKRLVKAGWKCEQKPIRRLARTEGIELPKPKRKPGRKG